MGFLDRLLGRDEPRATPTPRDSGGGELTDEQALERYRYLVRTAPPDRIEEAHEEAFARLTPEQRGQALQELSAAVPAGERAEGDDPRSLARMATRAEKRDPGSVERAFGRGGMGMGMGIGGTLLGSFAAAFAGTLVAQSLMDELGGEGDGEGEGEGGGESEGGGETADAGGGDFGGGDVGGGDVGGGGFGGGDFGGGGDAGGF
jgi:hypothetical protein